MRVVGKDQTVTYHPGTTSAAFYGGFGPYYSYGYATISSPASVSTDTVITVETLIYRSQGRQADVGEHQPHDQPGQPVLADR